LTTSVNSSQVTSMLRSRTVACWKHHKCDGTAITRKFTYFYISAPTL